MLIPHHQHPLSRKRDIPPISRVLVTNGNYERLLLSRLSREIFPRLRPPNTPFPEKMGIRMRPLYAFEWRGVQGPQRALYAGRTH